MNLTSTINIAGHRSLVGSAIHHNLVVKGYTKFVLRTHTERDIANQTAVHAFQEGDR